MKIKKRTLKTKHFKLGALEWGIAGAPKVLALHGWLDNANSFLPLAPHLNKLHVVAIDLIGHGLSEHPRPGYVYHFIDAVAQVHEALEALGWKSCHLLGHSMGAGISVLYAGTLPKRVEKLALVEGLGPFSRSPELGPEFLQKHIDSRNSLHFKRIPLYLKREDGAIARKSAGDLSIECARLLSERGLRKKGNRWTWRSDPRLRIESPMRLSEDQVQAYIRRIECPTLLVSGKNGLKFELAVMEERKKLFKNLREIALEGGHHLHMESPKVVGSMIQDFIAKG